MKQWWNRNDPDLGDLTKDTVEDATGCIPWLLETCVEDGKINLDATTLLGVWDQASLFVTDIQEQKIQWDSCVLLFSSLERY